MNNLDSEKVIKKIFKEIDREKEEMVSTARQLVRIPSLVGKELEAQKFIEGRLKEMGLKVDTFEAKLEEVETFAGEALAFLMGGGLLARNGLRKSSPAPCRVKNRMLVSGYLKTHFLTPTTTHLNLIFM